MVDRGWSAHSIDRGEHSQENIHLESGVLSLFCHIRQPHLRYCLWMKSPAGRRNCKQPAVMSCRVSILCLYYVWPFSFGPSCVNSDVVLHPIKEINIIAEWLDPNQTYTTTSPLHHSRHPSTVHHPIGLGQDAAGTITTKKHGFTTENRYQHGDDGGCPPSAYAAGTMLGKGLGDTRKGRTRIHPQSPQMGKNGQSTGASKARMAFKVARSE